MKEILLKKFMDEEGRKVFNMILRMVRNREETEDLFQEVFTAFHQNLANVQPEARRSYLYRIAYNKTLNRIKTIKRSHKLLQNQLNQPVLQKEPSQEKRNALIRESLGKLKATEAFLIELQFYQGKSYQEISEITGYSVSSVDSRLVRAKRKLRDLLNRSGINNLQESQLSAVL